MERVFFYGLLKDFCLWIFAFGFSPLDLFCGLAVV